MSERGLVLALQRLHDDPGFADLIKQDPQNTLGIYDLDGDEYQQILDAVQKGDVQPINSLAQKEGIDWEATQVSGLGAPEDVDVHTPGSTKAHPNALTGDGYDGVMPKRSAGA